LAIAAGCGEDDRVGWIELDGAANVRDLGALATEEGRVTAGHRLLRSDNLQDLSPGDVRRLVKDIGVTTVVDLRSPYEVASEGPGPLTQVGSVTHEYLSLLPDLGEGTDAAVALAIKRHDVALARYPDDLRCGYYLGYLEDRPDRVVTALRAIAQADGAALVNCAAGKDRTGVVIAMALSAAGVRPELVVADYAVSAERMDAIMGRLRATRTYQSEADTAPVADQTPRAQTMTAFLRVIGERHGGALGWLAGHGFGSQDAAALQAKLLA
jgi:protein tyrosine/serine phosphatase